MMLKSRRSPVPSENVLKNGCDTSSLESGLRFLMAANVKTSKHQKIIILLLFLGFLITLLNFYGLKQLEYNFDLQKDGFHVHKVINSTKPIVLITGRKIEAGYLKHVIEVFTKIGYQVIHNSTDGNWDVLWSHEYPFSNNGLTDLKLHQRVNHFPGSGFITAKMNLATSELKHIPKAFHLPREKEKFLEYAKKHSEKLWVKKSNDHRGIRVENLDKMDLDSSGTFVQEYIQKPFLIDGKKFDIGIYTILTSIDPLRVYIFESDALLRFCAKPYYPFNSTDLDSYVVGDHYTPTWEMPSLQKAFISLNSNMKETFNSYLRSLGKDPRFVWRQIEDAISTVYIEKEDLMMKLTNTMFTNSRHFFEMVRFDFALDEDLNVYLMEANMSPNLSSLHYAPNKLLYEQVIFNLLSLVGVARSIQFPSWNTRPNEIWNMMVTEKDLSVMQDRCLSDECHMLCSNPQCRVCYHCLTDNFKMIMKDAILEHSSKWNCKRILPSTMDSDVTPKGEVNKLQIEWFKGKCLQDKNWCSTH